MMQLPIYLDHAATTPVSPEVLADMLPFFSEVYANPAAIYTPGAEARVAVDGAREELAQAIFASPEEIFFTSGGTESNNWALKGAAITSAASKRHILTTPIEHRAVLEPAETLAKDGFDVEFLPVDGDGLVDPEDVAKRIRPNTALVSVMHANNEVGTIQPIAEIGAVCRERHVSFHTDAVQTLGKVPINVKQLNVDMMSFSAHKLYGPKGVGALYIRRGVRLAPYLEGGEQEKGRRAGTLNAPGIVGFGSAVTRSLDELPSESVRLESLRERLIGGVTSCIDNVRINGSRTRRLPNNVHFCFGGVEGESMLLALDMAGICASAGSACTAGSTEPSHVLLAMGLPVESARGALRLTLGKSTTEEQVDYVCERLRDIVQNLRSLSSKSAII
jgi:cysteine desulfurase